ncbi:hypothetical protein ABO04_10445 [Nitrosomonas sp. HPC101]|nr:hypothetical protein [Nitrosomonas sp. HPC101]
MPAVLVENMLLLRKEDFDELLDRAAENLPARRLAATFTAAEVVVPLFGEALPREAFVLLVFAVSNANTEHYP